MRCALLAVVALFGVTANVLGQASFNLDVPGRPELRARIDIYDDHLMLRYAGGRNQRFWRDEAADSPDLKYRGYSCLESGESLGLPVTGAGAIYMNSPATNFNWKLTPLRIDRIKAEPERPTVVQVTPNGTVTVIPGAEEKRPQVAFKPRETDTERFKEDVQPATIVFKNTSPFDLIIVAEGKSGTWEGSVAPGRTIEARIKLPPRDVEVTTITDFNPVTGQPTSRQQARASKSFESILVSVYEHKVTSTYRDATGRRPVTVEEYKSKRGVGSFSLTVGSEFSSTPIDAYRYAMRQNNPGGVKYLE